MTINERAQHSPYPYISAFRRFLTENPENSLKLGGKATGGLFGSHGNDFRPRKARRRGETTENCLPLCVSRFDVPLYPFGKWADEIVPKVKAHLGF